MALRIVGQWLRARTRLAVSERMREAQRRRAREARGKDGDARCEGVDALPGARPAARLGAEPEEEPVSEERVVPDERAGERRRRPGEELLGEGVEPGELARQVEVRVREELGRLGDRRHVRLRLVHDQAVERADGDDVGLVRAVQRRAAVVGAPHAHELVREVDVRRHRVELDVVVRALDRVSERAGRRDQVLGLEADAERNARVRAQRKAVVDER